MKITSRIKDYNVDFVGNALSKRKEILQYFKNAKPFFFIDKNFFEQYQKSIKAFVQDDFVRIINATEENKSYLKLSDDYQALIDAGLTRMDVLVTFGGGILQDISGFIASTLYRGIPWMYFPTTLLAQADSCIGSKTSINFHDSKNLIGTFYPPDRVVIDIDFCSTLSDEYFNSGLGEIIKFHLLADSKKFEMLKGYLQSDDLKNKNNLKDIILSTLEIKRSFFERDEFDAGYRNLLNYGHCFGHALESASNFSVCHGEAVLVGMGFANMVSLKRGMMSHDRYAQLEKILQRFYPRIDLSKIKSDEIIRYLKRDKKRISQDLTMILARDIGHHEKKNDIKEAEVIDTYRDFIKAYPYS